MKKRAAPVEEKFERQDFDLFEALGAIDAKKYNYYNSLSEEQRKKFVPYMLAHWTSAIKSNGQVANYYLMSTDVHANKHLFDERVQNHPELQWMMLCAASPGIGKQFHQWIPHLNPKIGSLKSRATTRDSEEYFAKIYKNVDSKLVKQYATEFAQAQNHKCKLAEMYPELKLSDIDTLAKLVSPEDIEQYEKESGYS